MATNTAVNTGIAEFFPGTTFGQRNFEDSGTVQYKSNTDWGGLGLSFNGSNYMKGASLPFDSGGSPASAYSKSAIELLRNYWNHGLIIPAA